MMNLVSVWRISNAAGGANLERAVIIRKAVQRKSFQGCNNTQMWTMEMDAFFIVVQKSAHHQSSYKQMKERTSY